MPTVLETNIKRKWISALLFVVRLTGLLVVYRTQLISLSKDISGNILLISNLFAAVPRFRNSLVGVVTEACRNVKRPHSVISMSSMSSSSSSSGGSAGTPTGKTNSIGLNYDSNCESPKPYHKSATLNSQCSVGMLHFFLLTLLPNFNVLLLCLHFGKYFHKSKRQRLNLCTLHCILSKKIKIYRIKYIVGDFKVTLVFADRTIIVNKVHFTRSAPKWFKLQLNENDLTDSKYLS